MAKAKIVTKSKPKKLVRLTLTEAEAQTLVAVARRVGGHTEDSPRKHTAAVMNALFDAGIDDPDHKTSDSNRGIYFYNFDGINHTNWGF